MAQAFLPVLGFCRQRYSSASPSAAFVISTRKAKFRPELRKRFARRPHPPRLYILKALLDRDRKGALFLGILHQSPQVVVNIEPLGSGIGDYLGLGFLEMFKIIWVAPVYQHYRWSRPYRHTRPMRLTLDLPDELSADLAASGHQDLPRAALEAIAIEAYRERNLSTAQLRRLLGFETRYELDGFLKQHEVWLEYSWEDLERDRETHLRLSL